MLKILKEMKRRDWICTGIAVIFIAVQVFLDLRMPEYMSEITMLVQTSGSEMNEILIAGGKMLVCALGSLISAMVVAICAARISADFGADLRGKLFTKVQSFSMEEMGKFSTSSLITRTTNDVTQVQILIVMGLQSVIKAPLMAGWAIIKIADKSREWMMSTAIAVGVLLVVVTVGIVVVLPKFRRLQRMTDDLNRVTRENLTGIRVVRAYNAEKYQETKFEKANKELTDAHLYTGRAMAFMMPSIQLVMNGLALAIYWVGAYLIQTAALFDKMPLFSDMVVFSQYSMQVVMAFMMLVILFMIYPRASVSSKRILEVLDTEPAIVDGTVTHTAPMVKGEIVFKNVSFRYPGAEEDMLQNVSFTVHKGETLAVIGSTGSGKSTLIHLIPRFYDVSEGEILVDGVNVKEYMQETLRNKIGFVAQKATLFSGSVCSNVAFGDNGAQVLKSDVVDAVYTAQAAEFVEKMEGTYNGYVAQGGTNLSGGQRQRLSIARAICRHPEILIFDDSFSALDYKTDHALRTRLKTDCANATKVIVAQRIGTIRNADKIIVLDEGKIAGMGKHEELMRDCEVYRQIARSQLSEEELA